MYFDLNVPVPTPALARAGAPQPAKKDKGKGKAPPADAGASFSPAQLAALEARIDLLVHLGYTAIALNQVAQSRVDPRGHTNVLDTLVASLRKRLGVVFLKRLTIVLDEDSEKGFGLTTGNTALFAPYDILALAPTTAATFSLACLTHAQPSPLTTHLIALPFGGPRLPFNLKHTLIRAALRAGAAFELPYAGALGEGPAAEGGGAGTRRNWWAGARELLRVTKGRGVVVSGGVGADVNLRAPRDIANLVTMLGLSQDAALETMTKTCKALVLRAQTRRTYRAVLSEPVVVFPGASGLLHADASRGPDPDGSAASHVTPPLGLQEGHKTPAVAPSVAAALAAASPAVPAAALPAAAVPAVASPAGAGRKRPLEDDVPEDVPSAEASHSPALSLAPTGVPAGGESRKKKRKKGKAPPDAGQS